MHSEYLAYYVALAVVVCTIWVIVRGAMKVVKATRHRVLVEAAVVCQHAGFRFSDLHMPDEANGAAHCAQLLRKLSYEAASDE